MIVLWNTIYMEAALNQLRLEGHQIYRADVVRLSQDRSADGLFSQRTELILLSLPIALTQFAMLAVEDSAPQSVSSLTTVELG
jgi:hypothetical protein